LAEATDCRRVRLLGYFGEKSQPCGNCDNCLNPPEVWDGTDAARKLLSTIYRIQQMSGMSFGAGHLMDIVRGKTTEKVTQYSHESLSTFGIGKDFTRVAIARGTAPADRHGRRGGGRAGLQYLAVDRPSRAQCSRAKLQCMLRESVSAPADRKPRRNARLGAVVKAPIDLDSEGLLRYSALKAWRAEVAQQTQLAGLCDFSRRHAWRPLHNVPLNLSTICRASAALEPRSWRLMPTTF